MSRECFPFVTQPDNELSSARNMNAPVAATRRAYASVMVVSITAPPQVLAERLAMRSRNSDGKIEQRLGRTVDETLSAPDVTIVNVSSAEYHARQLVRIIKSERWDA